jgi:hypothetical protein
LFPVIPDQPPEHPNNKTRDCDAPSTCQIVRAGRDPVPSELRVLEIEFRSGPVHQYFDVPEPNYNGLLAAKSKGNYFNLNIRNRFSSKEKAGSLKTAQSLS